MPSSLMPAAGDQPGRTTRLLDLLAKVPDPRDRRGVRYSLTGVLAVAISGVLAGARSFTAIGERAADLPAQALAELGVARAPEESTLRKLFARLDADSLDQQVGASLWTPTHRVGGRRMIALDGKTVRRARARNGQQTPHLVAAFDHASATVLEQVTVAAKNSIWKSRVDWAGAISDLAFCSSTPSSASVWAEPTCSTMRWRPPEYSAICTAVAPDFVRTRLMKAIHRS